MRKRVALLVAIAVLASVFAIGVAPALAASDIDLQAQAPTPQDQPPDPTRPQTGSMTGTAPTGGAPRSLATTLAKDSWASVDRSDEYQITTARTRAETVVADGKMSASITSPQLPTLTRFISTVKNPRLGGIVGVYVPGVLALRVVPQLANDPLYVAAIRGVATTTCGTGQCPSIGLLAHNYLSGELFFRLWIGQEVDLVYGDASQRQYRISGIRHYQALSPSDPYSSFVDLDKSGALLSSSDVFAQIYGPDNRLVFQTCIPFELEPAWGRLFVIAEPM